MGDVGTEFRQSGVWCFNAAIRRITFPSPPRHFAEAIRGSWVNKNFFLWELKFNFHSVTVFGTSPKYLSELRARNIVPRMYTLPRSPEFY